MQLPCQDDESTSTLRYSPHRSIIILRLDKVARGTHGATGRNPPEDPLHLRPLGQELGSAPAARLLPMPLNDRSQGLYFISIIQAL